MNNKNRGRHYDQTRQGKTRRRKWLLVILLVLVVVYFAGPSPRSPVYSPDMPVVPDDLNEIELYVQQIESTHHMKHDNEARIVWVNDSMPQVTNYSIVYLHGFSASQKEGDPIH